MQQVHTEVEKYEVCVIKSQFFLEILRSSIWVCITESTNLVFSRTYLILAQDILVTWISHYLMLLKLLQF